MTTRLRSMLTRIALGLPVGFVAACGCPKISRTETRRTDVSHPPAGTYRLLECATSTTLGHHDCRYEDEPRGATLWLVLPCPEDQCEPPEVLDAAALAAFAGRCEADRCAYTAGDRQVIVARVAPGFDDGAVDHECALEADGTELVCWEVRNATCRAGRLPPGAVHGRARVPDDADRAHLVRQAILEAGSVPAFEAIARELALHGAPPAMIRAARSAADDERRHAAQIARLAATHVRVAVTTPPPRSLRDLALDNAREGCGREVYGALEAYVQGQRATSPAARATFAALARDEARHALLSFAIDDWARARLGARSGHHLDDARAEALATLAPAHESAALGLPDAEGAARIAAVAAQKN